MNPTGCARSCPTLSGFPFLASYSRRDSSANIPLADELALFAGNAVPAGVIVACAGGGAGAMLGRGGIFDRDGVR